MISFSPASPMRLHCIPSSGTCSFKEHRLIFDDNVGDPVTVSGTVTVDSEFSTAAALADAASATPTTTTAGSIPLLMNATTVDRQRAVVDTLDSAGTGIAAAGIVGQYDDAGTTAVTENKFAPVRISSRRALLVEGVASGTAQGVSIASGGVASGALASGSVASGAVASGAFASGALASGSIAAGAIAAGATSIAANEDDASADLDRGVKVMAVQKATPANTAGSDGDYEMLQMSAGRVWTSTSIPSGGVASGAIASGAVASGAFASGALASGAVSSGAVASGAFASGALAAGSIAVGAITAGDTSIATTEDAARAAGEHLVKVGVSRLDTPVANAGVGSDNDYTNIIVDNFGKVWGAGAIPEDTAHISGEAIVATGSRRIATLATSSGTDADWSTVNQSNEGAAWVTQSATATPNGLLVANFTSGDTYTALTATAQVIKASAGNLYGYYIFNPSNATAYVLVYNIAAASVTVGTSTAILVYAIGTGMGANIMFPVPIPFSNAGWSCAAATTGGGNSAPNVALEVMFYYL